MERIVQYVNDVTKDFDDHIPCRGGVWQEACQDGVEFHRIHGKSECT
jgi:hypothetical protein